MVSVSCRAERELLFAREDGCSTVWVGSVFPPFSSICLAGKVGRGALEKKVLQMVSFPIDVPSWDELRDEKGGRNIIAKRAIECWI